MPPATEVKASFRSIRPAPAHFQPASRLRNTCQTQSAKQDSPVPLRPFDQTRTINLNLSEACLAPGSVFMPGRTETGAVIIEPTAFSPKLSYEERVKQRLYKRERSGRAEDAIDAAMYIADTLTAGGALLFYKELMKPQGRLAGLMREGLKQVSAFARRVFGFDKDERQERLELISKLILSAGKDLLQELAVADRIYQANRSSAAEERLHCSSSVRGPSLEDAKEQVALATQIRKRTVDAVLLKILRAANYL